MQNQDLRIPSFFKNSYVKSKYVFHENKESFLENIFTDYDTPNYIRIMKKATTPVYDHGFTDESEITEEESQKQYFLRCYLPKIKLAQEQHENRIKDVVIMINGLNELKRYDLYDLLGSYFASNGLGSILLPTPYHLNRRNGELPTDVAARNPLLFYYNFKRTIYELENLCDKIRGDIIDDEDLGFYKSCFARGEGVKIRITTLGFSLGGVKVLGAFMRDISHTKKDRYQSCITFNSTADPFLADPRRIGVDPIVWQKIKLAVNGAINENKIWEDGTNKDISQIFEWLYNRNKNMKLVEDLKANSKKFLMIQSAADKIVSEKDNWNITDPEFGLNRVVFAGVDHIVTMDEKWHQYMKPVTEQMIGFIQNSNDSSFSHQRLEDQIKSIIKDTKTYIDLKKNYPDKERIENMDFSNRLFGDICSEIEEKKDKTERDRFIELYYLSKVYYPKFPELLAIIMYGNKDAAI